MALVETYRSRDRFRKGQVHWDAERRFETPNEESQAHEDGLWFQPYPELLRGVYTPVCTGVAVRENYDPDKRPGFASIRALYKTLRQPGKAEISIVSTLESMKLEEDLDGLQLVGAVDTSVEPGKVGRFKTNGQTFLTDPKRLFVWKAAFDTKAGVNALNNRMGRINSSRSPRMFGAPAQTLRIIQMQIQHVYTGQDLWYVNVGFEEEEEGWNNVIKRNSEVRLPVRMPVFELGDEGKILTPVADAQKTDQMQWVSGYAQVDPVTGVWTNIQQDDEDTRVLKTTDFNIFNNLLDEW